jgi:hypothetical protein
MAVMLRSDVARARIRRERAALVKPPSPPPHTRATPPITRRLLDGIKVILLAVLGLAVNVILYGLALLAGALFFGVVTGVMWLAFSWLLGDLTLPSR